MGERYASVAPETISALNEAEDNDYEEMRKRNERAKFALLRKLGILHGIENLKSRNSQSVVCVKKSHPIKKTLPPINSPEPVRKSPRLAKIPSDNLAESVKKEDTKERKESSVHRKYFMGPERMTLISSSENEVKSSFEDLLPHLREVPSAHYVASLMKSLDKFKASLKKMALPQEYVQKVGIKTHSLLIHPSESKLLVIAGDAAGFIGFWNIKNNAKEVEMYRPHRSPVFCLSVCVYNPVKLYATAFDGIVRDCDLEKMQFNDVYVSEDEDHTVYHAQMSPYTLLVAHGCGDVALVDMRENKKPSRWIDCHDRSVRTIHRHPLIEHEFATSSAVGEAAIWDIRNHRKQKPLLLLPHPKGLKSAFFSPGGGMLLTSCNDDHIRIYASDKNHLIMSKAHNMQTGRWLRPFQAMWHPRRDDTFVIGSLDKPRQVNVCGIHGLLLHSLRSPNLNTVLSNCQFHASQDIIVGANNSGSVHVFQGSEE